MEIAFCRNAKGKEQGPLQFGPFLNPTHSGSLVHRIALYWLQQQYMNEVLQIVLSLLFLFDVLVFPM